MKKHLSEKHKLKISESLKNHFKNGSSPLLGRERPRLVRERISEGRKRNLIVGDENSLSKNWLVTFPDGHKEKVTSLCNFCKEHNLLRQNMYKVAKGDISQHKGFKCRKM